MPLRRSKPSVKERRMRAPSLTSLPSSPPAIVITLIGSVLTVAGFLIQNGIVRVGAWVGLLVLLYVITHSARNTKQELSRLRSGLNEISLNETLTYDEDLRIVYFVGNVGPEDREVRMHRTAAAPQQPIAWRSLSFEATGKGAGGVDAVTVAVRSKKSAQQFTFLVINEADGRMRGLVAFLPPIAGGSELEWEVECAWPGVWAQLREQGRDDFFFNQCLPGRVSLTFDLVMPTSMTRPQFRSRPTEGVVSVRTIEGREAIRWHLASAPQGLYRFSVTAAPRD